MAVIDVIEPATENVLESLEQITPAELDDVIARAAVAQRQWAAQAPQFRAEVLLSIAAAIDHNQEDLARLEARNVGMPISDARGAVAGSRRRSAITRPPRNAYWDTPSRWRAAWI